MSVPLDVVPLVRCLVVTRHQLSCNPHSSRLRQRYYGLNLALASLGYDFLPEQGETWQSAIRSPSVFP